MISRHPSHRRATLSLMIVRIWTPMISIAADGTGGAIAPPTLSKAAPAYPALPSDAAMTAKIDR